MEGAAQGEQVRSLPTGVGISKQVGSSATAKGHTASKTEKSSNKAKGAENKVTKWLEKLSIKDSERSQFSAADV